jgi:hypothetical protein
VADIHTLPDWLRSAHGMSVACRLAKAIRIGCSSDEEARDGALNSLTSSLPLRPMTAVRLLSDKDLTPRRDVIRGRERR